MCPGAGPRLSRRIGVVRPPLPGPLACARSAGVLLEQGLSPAGAAARYLQFWDRCPRPCRDRVPIAVFWPGDPWNLVLEALQGRAGGAAASRHFASLLRRQDRQYSLAIHGDLPRRETGGFDAYCVVPTSRQPARSR